MPSAARATSRPPCSGLVRFRTRSCCTAAVSQSPMLHAARDRRAVDFTRRVSRFCKVSVELLSQRLLYFDGRRNPRNLRLSAPRSLGPVKSGGLDRTYTNQCSETEGCSGLLLQATGWSGRHPHGRCETRRIRVGRLGSRIVRRLALHVFPQTPIRSRHSAAGHVSGDGASLVAPDRLP